MMVQREMSLKHRVARGGRLFIEVFVSVTLVVILRHSGAMSGLWETLGATAKKVNAGKPWLESEVRSPNGTPTESPGNLDGFAAKVAFIARAVKQITVFLSGAWSRTLTRFVDTGRLEFSHSMIHQLTGAT